MFHGSQVRLQQQGTLMGLQHHGSSSTARALTPEQLDAVLLPTVAVSEHGYGSHGTCSRHTHLRCYSCLVFST